MRENTICSFFGHSDIDITDELYSATLNTIENIIKEGCRTFYFGGFGDFDELCYKIVSQIKEENEPSIKRIYCVLQERELRKLPRGISYGDYDEIIYLVPQFEGWYKRIYFRNCEIINRSDYVVFYAENRENSGAYKVYTYAKKKKDKTIINLYGK